MGDEAEERVRKLSGMSPGGPRFKVNRVEFMTDLPEDGVLDNPQGTEERRYRSPSIISTRKGSLCLTQLTREALPRLDNYRNLSSVQAALRPTLEELHDDDLSKDPDAQIPSADNSPGGHGVKLGWIQGVFIPCLLNIWGVMLFLRLSWVVAHAGVGESLVIIGISAVVTVLTTLSLSAISTNGEVKGGGIYYIISRSLGPEFGASVGVIFAIANAVAASMNTIGFCESLNDLLRTNSLKIVDNSVNDIRIVGVIAILIMVIICAVGMEWESKAQNLLVIIIVGAMTDFMLGAFIGPRGSKKEEQIAKGFVGLNTEVFEKNWYPDYRYSQKVSQDFFSVFAIFFPSVTGIQAGANISGDLKDPSYSIPKGTLLSLLISMTSYAIFVLLAGFSVVRDATGIVSNLVNGTCMAQCTNCSFAPGGHCSYGLHNSFSVMQLVSLSNYLIYAGCFAATLSTALTNLLSVPRLIQALGIDRIYPGLIFFSKGYGKAGEPYRGYVLTFFVSSAFLLIAELNAIAPLISNFYLASYAMINFCTFHAALVKPIGWRPTFRYYNVWTSLFGFVLCVAIMFLIDWMASLITFALILALYLVVVYRKPDVNWGSTTQAQTYKNALSSSHRLIHIEEHVKNFRPQILVLSGRPSVRPALTDFAHLITKHIALMVCGEISQERFTSRQRNTLMKKGYGWLKLQKIKAFYSIVDGMNFEDGARALMQASGIGKLKPNILLMGYKSKWKSCEPEEMISYFNVLHDGFDNTMGVAIFRLKEGLEDANTKTNEGSITTQETFKGNGYVNNAYSGSTESLDCIDSSTAGGSEPETSACSDTDTPAEITRTQFAPPDSPALKKKGDNKLKEQAKNPYEILMMKKREQAKILMNQTENGQAVSDVEANVKDNENSEGSSPNPAFDIKNIPPKDRTIDVWWLYDDGGLTLLLPYIITTRQNWSNCKLRIFALASKKNQLEIEERSMASLLSKFRIDYSSLTMIDNVTKDPDESSRNFFKDLIQDFRETSGRDDGCVITESELVAVKGKTRRHLRLRELLLENSKDSSLVVMSLPMPRKGMVSAPLYLAWLETLTRDMPPFLLVRGNQSSVLTFYS